MEAMRRAIGFAAIFSLLGAIATLALVNATTRSQTRLLEFMHPRGGRQDWSRWWIVDTDSERHRGWVVDESDTPIHTYLCYMRPTAAHEPPSFPVMPSPDWVDRPPFPPLPVESEKLVLNLKFWIAAGWPVRCVRWSAMLSVDRASPYGIAVVQERGAVRLRIGDDVYFFPYRPLWPGLLANTAFYAVILWAIWFTPGAIKRGLRTRRGACMRCGYDLRGAEHETCPECGSRHGKSEHANP
jgi:hypothetical protein